MATLTTTRNARKAQLWAELGELYREEGDGPHFEHLRNIDRAYFDERRRLGLIEVESTKRYEREQARRPPESAEAARLRMAAEEAHRARQRELDRQAAHAWADQYGFTGRERAELLAAVEAGEDMLKAGNRIRERHGAYEERLTRIEERLGS